MLEMHIYLHRNLHNGNGNSGSNHPFNHGVIILNRRVPVTVIMREGAMGNNAVGAGKTNFGDFFTYIPATAVIVFETAMVVVLVVLFPASSVAVTVMV